MLMTSYATLKRLAAFVWYTGVVVLFIKSCALFIEAYNGRVHPVWLIVAVLIGLTIGWIKAKYMFVSICKRNLTRLSQLKKPRLWQFYRGRFFIFLGVMVMVGHYLSKWAHGDNLNLIFVAVVELSIAIALLLSSHCFWRR